MTGPAEITNATPQLTVLQRVGGSVGTAILSVVLANSLDGARTPVAAADAFASTYCWALVVTLAAAVPALVLVRIERRARRERARETADERAADERGPHEEAAAARVEVGVA